MKFVDAGGPMPPRAQRAALSAMWLSVGASLAFLFVTGRLEPAVAVLMVTAAAIGTWAIRLAGRRRSSRDPVTES
jgi:hypothetical protein